MVACVERSFGKTTEMLKFFKVLLCGMQYYHPDFPKKFSVQSAFITKTIGVQLGLKEGLSRVLSCFQGGHGVRGGAAQRVIVTFRLDRK